MIDLGQHIIKKYEPGLVCHEGDWVLKGDELWESKSGGWNLIFKRNGLEEDMVSINHEVYFKVGHSQKPPLGLIPKKIHNENRLEDIRNAINRYLSKKNEIPLEWIDEYNEIVSRLGK